MSEKKRSTYKKGSLLDLPNHADKSKFAYRWVNANKVSQSSDGYDPRGWELDKNAEGNTTRRGDDAILARMPLDLFEDMKAQKDEERLNQVKTYLEAQAAAEEELSHEFRKKGGKTKFKFEQE
jgi:hypothetical protein